MTLAAAILGSPRRRLALLGSRGIGAGGAEGRGAEPRGRRLRGGGSDTMGQCGITSSKTVLVFLNLIFWVSPVGSEKMGASQRCGGLGPSAVRGPALREVRAALPRCCPALRPPGSAALSRVCFTVSHFPLNSLKAFVFPWEAALCAVFSFPSRPPPELGGG